MSKSETPRYVIGKGPLTYELPVVREHDGRELARLSVSNFGWPEALQTALSWAIDYTATFDKKNMPPKPVKFWPEVRVTRYAGTSSEITQRRMAKRIDGGTVWAEQRNEGEGAWLPVDAVRA